MRKSLFYCITINLKKNLISIISISFIIGLVIYSSENLEAVKDGLDIWVNNVIPSLFPFFVATEILCSTNFVNILGRLLEKPVSRIFNVPGEGVFPLIMGTISGYPSRCKNCCKFKKTKYSNT